VGIFKIQ